MTGRLRWFLAAWLLLLCGAPVLYSQGVGPESNPLGDDKAKTKILIGPIFGANRNNHTGGFRTINDVSCPKFSAGSGWGYSVGLSAEITRGTSWSIIPRLLYESRPGHFVEDMPDAKVLMPETQTVVLQTVSATSDVTYQLLNLELLYKHQLFSVGPNFRVGAALGPTAGMVLGGKLTQVLDLEEPLNARFLNPRNLPTERSGRRLIFAKDEDIPARQSFRFSLKGGLVGEVGLFNNAWMMSPGVYFDYGLTHVTSNENWNLNTVLFQVDFRHAF